MRRDFRDSIVDTHERFLADRKTVNAVVRSLEVLGEAAKNVPEEVQAEFPGIPWRSIVGRRNTLIHESFGIDADMLWIVLSEELPLVRKDIQRLYDRFGK